MKKTHTIPLIVVMLLLGGIEAAFAGGPRWSSKPLPSKYESGKVNLNLTENQTKELQDLRLEYQKEMLEARGTLQIKRLELRGQLLSEEPNRAKIDSLVEERGELWTDIQKKILDYQLKVKEILTEEQWNKLRLYHSFGNKARKGRDVGGRGYSRCLRALP
ncbi:MAG: Spy/CpxP family protein refolding chaperone [Candidatus Aerophobetes bacterium]|nr:Spy/CpxP family protein refolding chaperone [Candidatus Aerophobetes bacterium]